MTTKGSGSGSGMGADVNYSSSGRPSSSASEMRSGEINKTSKRFNHAGAGAGALTAEEVDAVLENMNTHERSKTWTRIVVEKFLSKFSWYNPKKDVPDAPSLSKAYTYYEHITLPRRLVNPGSVDHVQRRAERGETQEETELYNPFFTPSSNLIEWGIGVDSYFSTLRWMSIILLVAGIIQLPSARYFANRDYNPDGSKKDLDFTLQGSAICTATEWVICPECANHTTDRHEWGDRETQYRHGLDPDTGTFFVLRNACEGPSWEGATYNWLGLLWMLVSVMVVSFYLNAREVRFDEDKVTVTDYSVMVQNPPPDALDPDEWRHFFETYAEDGKGVTAVTIALNNEKLLRTLIIRRIFLHRLRAHLPKDADLDDEDLVRALVAGIEHEMATEPRGIVRKIFNCTVLPILHLLNIALPPQTLVDRVFQLTDEIKELQKEKYEATKVIVTFESEEGQRNALTALSCGEMYVMFNMKPIMGAGNTFQGRVLRVTEAPEPSAVRWMDLSVSFVARTLWQAITFALTCGILGVTGKIVSYIRFETGLSGITGYVVSAFNSIVPIVIKMVLMRFEPHHSSGSWQASLYLKITLFRWVNTAFLPKWITPFANTLSDGRKDVLKFIDGLLWSEFWLVPTLRLIDIVGNFKKHILAPRERTQELMNMNFQGTPYNLGERYTDLVKVVFLCVFYSSLFPTTFFSGFAILTVQYYADKYCLMRIWGWTPFLGSELASFTRRYFFSLVILAYAVISAYAWAQFPYDNVCVTNQTVATGVYTNVRFGNGTVRDLVIEDDFQYSFCKQRFDGWDFIYPPLPEVQPKGSEWMDDQQEGIVIMFGLISLFVLFGFLFFISGRAIFGSIMRIFHNVYAPGKRVHAFLHGVPSRKFSLSTSLLMGPPLPIGIFGDITTTHVVADGQVQHIDFSSSEEIFGYVPQISQPGFPFPFLCCDIDDIPQSLIGWNDPSRSYDHYNLIFDVPWDGLRRYKTIDVNTRGKGGTLGDQEEIENRESGRTASKLKKNPIYSMIKHYPPKWMAKLAAQKEEDDDEGK